ncbi:S4 domain-containing protein [Candidatus Vidania fulgoroideorum]
MKIKRSNLCRRFKNLLGLFSFFKKFKKRKKILFKKNNRKEIKYDFILKRKVRIFYCLKKKQLENILANLKLNIINSINLLIYNLEKRLDSFIYRIGFASTIRESRQIILHGFILINGKKVNYPSFKLKENDKIEIKKNFKKNKKLNNFISLFLKLKNIKKYDTDYINKISIFKNFENIEKHEIFKDEI